MSEFPESQHEFEPLFPFCEFSLSSQEHHQSCLPSIKRTKTPFGNCYTINAGGEFGKVKRVGEKQGLDVVIDMKNVNKFQERFHDDNLKEVKVCITMVFNILIFK